MTTLEMMIEDIYKDCGYMYNESVIHSTAEYIENYNANKSPDEAVMTPKRWWRETKEANPKAFITKNEVFGKIATYFIKQRELCIDQTGCQPCYEDWAQEMESDEYKDAIGEWAEVVTITDFLNWLLDTADDVMPDWC